MHISTAIVFVSFDVFTILSQIPSTLSCSHKVSQPIKPTEEPPAAKHYPTKTRYDPNSKCPPCECMPKYQSSPEYRKLSMDEMSSYPFVRDVEAKENDFPWIAALHADGQIYCAATIISPQYLLTAAQCVDGYSIKVNKIRAKVGVFDRLLDINSQKFTIEKIIIHPKYTRRTKTFNIAMLRLNKPIVFDTRHIQQACLPGDGSKKDYTGYIGVVAQWGLTGYQPKSTNALHTFQLPIIGNDYCKKVTSLDPERIADHTLCAGLPEKYENTCTGDEGGPLHLFGNPSEVIGVITPNRNCSKIQPPSIYTRVSSFMEWIENSVGNECLCKV